MLSRNVLWVTAKFNLFISHLHVSRTLAWQLLFWKEKSRNVRATKCQTEKLGDSEYLEGSHVNKRNKKYLWADPIVMQTKFTSFLMLFGDICNKGPWCAYPLLFLWPYAFKQVFIACDSRVSSWDFSHLVPQLPSFESSEILCLGSREPTPKMPWKTINQTHMIRVCSRFWGQKDILLAYEEGFIK